MINEFTLPETDSSYSVTYIRDSAGEVTLRINRHGTITCHKAEWDGPLTDEQWAAWTYFALTCPRVLEVSLSSVEEDFMRLVLNNHQTEQGESNV